MIMEPTADFVIRRKKANIVGICLGKEFAAALGTGADIIKLSQGQLPLAGQDG
jgi:carbamoylphosphate synthase small subunit